MFAPAYTAVASSARGGVVVSVPTSKTVYNGGTSVVTPKVHVQSGVHKIIRSMRIMAFANKHKVASGPSIRLPIGSYNLQTRVVYRSWKYVTKTRVVTVWVGDRTPSNTRCVITAVSSSDDVVNDTIDSANCTNAADPGKTIRVNGDDLYDVFQDTYEVGQTVSSDVVDFPGHSVKQSKRYQVRAFGPSKAMTTHKTAYTVRDGGHERIYTNSESANTDYFTVPSHWSAGYAFNCASFGMSGNWILTLHQLGGSVLDDNLLRNQIQYSGSDAWNFSGSGTFQFQVITECDWAIVVRWK
jgi:hypothetical protein